MGCPLELLAAFLCFVFHANSNPPAPALGCGGSGCTLDPLGAGMQKYPDPLITIAMGYRKVIHLALLLLLADERHLLLSGC